VARAFVQRNLNSAQLPFWLPRPAEYFRLGLGSAQFGTVIVSFIHEITCMICMIESFISSFDFDFLSTSQEIGWEERPQRDLFTVEWVVKP